jgi:hypothetical protein
VSGWLRRCAVTVLAGLVAAGGMTVAHARWAGRASGTGSAVTGTSLPVSLAPGTAAAALYPQGTAPVRVVATNPNPGPVRVDRLVLDTSRGTAGLAVDAGHAGCTTGGITVSPADNSGLGWLVPASGTLTLTLDGAIAADASLANACQGAALTVYLKAS